MEIAILVAAAGFAAISVAGLVWALRIARRGDGGEPRCGFCDYNLTHATSNRCPECGRLFIEAGVLIGGERLSRRQRRVRTILLVLAPVTLTFVAGMTVSILSYQRAVVARQVAQAQAARAAALQAQAASVLRARQVLQTTRPADAVRSLDGNVIEDESEDP